MSLTTHAPALGSVAGGNHCSAANDEPEPRFIRQPESDGIMRDGKLVKCAAWLDTQQKRVVHLYSWCDPNKDFAR